MNLARPAAVLIDQGRAATAVGGAAAGGTTSLGSGTATLVAPSALGGAARPATTTRSAVTSQTQLMKKSDAAGLNPQPLLPGAPDPANAAHRWDVVQPSSR